MGDLISRQAAIDFVDAGHLCNPNEPRWSDNEVVNFLKSRPSAQPERKKGKWKVLDKNNMWFTPHMYQCPFCGNVLDKMGVNAGRGDANFCPNCGAEMEGDTE